MTLKLNGSSSGSVSLDAPASTTSGADITFNLPVADGSSGQALTTNASGQLAFSSVGQSSDSVAKAWVVFKGDSSNTVADHYNIDSVTDNGTGDYTFTFDTDFANINYCIAGNAGYSFNPNSSNAGGSGYPYNYFIRNRNVGSCRVEINAGNNGGVLDDANDVNVVWFGDQ